MKLFLRHRSGTVDLRVHNREQTGVDWFSWSYLGGPDAGQAWLFSHDATLDDAFRLLRAKVQIFDDNGDRCWWGFVQAVRLGRWRVSLDQVYNRIGVEFEDGITDWLESGDSIGKYGTREYLLARRDDSESVSAVLLRDMFLYQHKEPRVEILSTPTPTGGPASQGTLVLELLGWWHTLNWKYYNSTLTGMAATGGAGGVWANFGRTTAQRIAQIYTIPAGNFSMVGRVNFTVKKLNNPADDVIVRLRDYWAANVIGDIVATAVVPAGDIDGTGVAVSPAFRSKARVGANRSYFLEFDREDARNDIDYYAVERALAGGTGFLTQDAAGAWTGPASTDLHLWLSGVGYTNVATLLGDIVTASGQFFAGPDVDYFTPSLNAYYGGWVRAGDLIEDLVTRGDGVNNRLVVRAELRGSDVWLRITSQPADVGLRLAAGGEIWQKELKMPGSQLGRFVGQWVQLKEAPERSLFIERGRYDARTGRLTTE